MKRRGVRHQSDGLTNHFHGNLIPAHLMCDDSQQLQCFGMAWVRGQDLPVDRLRLGQSPALVVLDSDGKCFRNGHEGGLEHGFAHHARHISRYACSTLRAKRGASINGEAAIRSRSVERSRASRAASCARSTAIRR